VKGNRSVVPVLSMAEDLRLHLQQGRRVDKFPLRSQENFNLIASELRFLTSKPMIYLVNVDEDCLMAETNWVQQVRQIGEDEEIEVIILSAKLEADIMDMPPEDQAEYLSLSGVEESGLSQVIQSSFKILGLISFFTKNEKEVRAWEIPKGLTAPQAAGVIHTDFERGFIRAEVVPYPTFVEYGSDAAVKAAGKMRLEGKEYIVEDGDIIYFRFNV